MGDKSVNKPFIVRDFFGPETAATIRRWMREWAPFVPWGEDRSEFVRLYGHNPPFLVNIHRQLANYASEVFGEPLKPSYVFLSMYKDGGTCPLHLDRPQCYRTIDYLIQQDQDEPWPILIGRTLTDIERERGLQLRVQGQDQRDRGAVIDSQEWTTCLLKPNDAVLYSGTHNWHYRPEKLNGTADLAFFHFVPENYDGPLD